MKKKMGKIENWSIKLIMENEYQAPELGRSAIVGNVYNDARAVDGTGITTSRINKIDLKESIAETNNSLYELGVIDSGFESYMKDNGYTINQYVENING